LASHEPQLFGSFFKSTQTPAQTVALALHTQAPLWHVAAEEQTLPHVPQLLLSTFLSTHSTPHWSFAGQTQAPAVQDSNPGHTAPSSIFPLQLLSLPSQSSVAPG
jgi:hypothetical protein